MIRNKINAAVAQVAEGALAFDSVTLAIGDGASTEKTGSLNFVAAKRTEALLFDLT